MPFPKYGEIAEAMLLYLYGRPGHQAKTSSTYEPLADEFGLSAFEREMPRDDGSGRRKWHHRVQNGRQELKQKGYLSESKHGICQLSAKGIAAAEKIIEETPFQEDRSTERTEGGETVVTLVRRKRYKELRDEAIDFHGLCCMACDFNFEKFYGKKMGERFIEVHHVVPLAKRGKGKTNPKTDLEVLCSNCHSMIHRLEGSPLRAERLKEHIRR